jgi:hypothetical protein
VGLIWRAASGSISRGRWRSAGSKHRAAAAICALLGAGVLGGCAGARGPSTHAAAVTPAIAGRVFARAVNIHVSDLPGAEAEGLEGPGPNPGAGALAFTRCDEGVSPKRVVLEARSTLLSAGRGSLLVRSRVTLWPSEALASRNLAAFASELGSRCELRYGGTSVSRLSVALPKGARALGLRVAVRSPGDHASEIGYHDIIGFVCGPAEIVLTAVAYSRPVESQTEQRLLEALSRRASAARSEV